MKKLTVFVAALVLNLGLAQCKKEQSNTANNAQSVQITLNVNGGASASSGANGSRVNVDPNAAEQVTFEEGDQILVASGGAYVGTLTHNGSGFSGEITDPAEGEPLYFYFLGNKTPVFDAENNSCTVSISDQTNELPVISMGKSNQTYPSEGNAYSSRLYNKCSLMGLNVTMPSTAATSPIFITGMKNTVKVYFNNPTDEGFEYGMDGEGVIKMAGGNGSEQTSDTKWAIVLPQDAVDNAPVVIENYYIGYFANIPEIEVNKWVSNIEMTSTVVFLNKINEDFVATDGQVLTNEIRSYAYGISIADGVTVTLKDATIGCYKAFACLGNANIILEGTNKSYGGYRAAGIYVPSGKTLTVDGSGSLEAAGSSSAGIGAGYNQDCGNIVINGGTITAGASATGPYAAGIGSTQERTCGNITINGGTIIATSTGSAFSAGIGSGYGGTCGLITITNGVTSVTATKGSSAPNSIGAGKNGSCGTVTIGGTIYWDGTNYQNGSDGYLTISPLVYPQQ